MADAVSPKETTNHASAEWLAGYNAAKAQVKLLILLGQEKNIFPDEPNFCPACGESLTAEKIRGGESQ